eukprot:SAG11_NODE_268_length_11447_cov_3.136135_14_plen_101_part_00
MCAHRSRAFRLKAAIARAHSQAQAQAAELRGLVAQQSEDVLAIAEAMRHEVAAAQGNMANQVAALGEELKCFAPKIALDDLSLKVRTLRMLSHVKSTLAP